MTPEEALNKLDETLIGNLELKIALSKALEKQIAKNPKEEGWLYCPVCGLDVLMSKYNYCPDCGQKINWNGEGY
jgi:rubrerythrin